MSYSDGKIIAPVSVADVMSVVPVSLQRTNTQTQQTERGSSCDVGVLCGATVGQTIPARDGKGNWTVVSRTPINMWAKFKPIYCSDIGLLKNSRRTNSGHTVSGYSISWGIMKPSSWSWTDYINTSTGQVKSGKWGYDKPTGGSSSPYRLTDFVEIDNNGNTTGNGYSHKAVCPIAFHFSEDSNLYVPKGSLYDGTIISFLFTFQNGVMGWNPGYCMGISELFSFEMDYYPTIIMTCYQNGRVWEYSKSGEQKVRYYTGNVNPYVQILVDTKDICEAVSHDGASYNSGPLADGQIWTCCMVLTSLRIEGSASSHVVSSGSIRRLEYEDGVDRRDLTVVNMTPIDNITAMSYTLTIQRSNYGYYYISSISVTTTSTGNDTLNFSVDGLFVCLVGVIGGTGWSGSQQQEKREGWTSLSINSGSTVTRTLNADMPEFRFSGDVGPNTRVAAGDITFRIGSASLTGSFGINVYGGASTYTTTVTIK